MFMEECIQKMGQTSSITGKMNGTFEARPFYIYIHTVSRPESTKLCDMQLIILSLLYNHPSQASDIFTAYNFEYDILERS